MIANNPEVGAAVRASIPKLRIANLVSSAFYGGPERIMIGLAKELPARYESLFFVFAEGGRGEEFRGKEMIDVARREGFTTVEIEHDVPNLIAMARETAAKLRQNGADVLCCHGYKADVVGYLAARLAKIPCVGIAHFWVASTKKLAVYMALDWMALRRMDATIAVCDSQRERLIADGVRPERITTIRNAIEAPLEIPSGLKARESIQAYFAAPKRLIVGTAARLSVEKGIDVLIRAVEIVHRRVPDAGFVVFGDGPRKEQLAASIAEKRLQDTLVLAGFRSGAQSLFSGLDIMAMASRAEGLPVAILEAMSVGIPVVSTAVDGIPEAIVDGETGYLVASEDHTALADRLLKMLESADMRATMGARGRARVLAEFAFPLQAERYGEVYDRVARRRIAATN